MGRRLFNCLGKCSRTIIPNKSHGQVVDPPVPAASSPSSDGPVLVELFTSQGCAKSPSAEHLLSRIVKGDFHLDAPVVVLSYHVDSWDYLGWEDPYGSSHWTIRQKGYAEALKLESMGTPQVVVQGRAHCPANEEEDLLSTISKAPRFPAPKFKANFQRPTSETLEVTLTGALRCKVDNNVDNVMIALYENGLVNECLDGENKGKVMYNDFVVRKLEKLCTVDDISAKKMLSVTVTFTLWDGFNSSKCSVVVFVQNTSQQIFGSQNFQLPDDL